MKNLKPFLTTVFLTITLILIFALAYMLVVSDNKPLDNEKIVTQHQVITNDDFDISINPTLIATNEDSFYFITKDGIMLKDTENKMIWQDTYSFNKIHTKHSKNYVVVTELLSNNAQVYLYDEKGLVFAIDKILNEVAYIDVNDNGYITIIFNKKNGYDLHVYDNVGKLLYTHVFEDGKTIPLSTALSNDNKTLYVNQLDTSKLNMITLNVFINIQDPETNGIFAIQTFYDDYFYKTGFLDETTLATISNKHVYLITVDGVEANVTTTIELKNEIKDAIIQNNHILLVYGETINNSNEYPINTIQIIDKNGEVQSLLNSNNVTYINSSNNSFIVGSNNTLYFYDFKGKPIWNIYSEFLPKHVVALEKGTLGVFSGVDKIQLIKYNK